MTRSVKSPHSATHVAQAIADTITERANRDDKGSTGLVYYWLTHDPAELSGRSRIWLQVRQMLGTQPVPLVAANWIRLITGPTPDDLKQHGIGMLRWAPLIGDHTVASLGLRLLRNVLTTGKAISPQAHAQLEQLYDGIVQAPAKGQPYPENWETLATQCETAALNRLSPRARASALHLLMPLFALHEKRLRDENLKRLMASRYDPVHAQAAIDLINSWSLPGETHKEFVAHITGQQASARSR